MPRNPRSYTQASQAIFLTASGSTRTNSSQALPVATNLTRLVYYERFFYPDAAIAREKEIKGWRRSKKITLIESMNPRWDDLAKNWGNEYKPESAADQREIPHPLEKTRGLGMTPSRGFDS
jgi:hypothetical protein